MRINNIGYLLKEGMRGIFLHGFMSFAAVCVTVAQSRQAGPYTLMQGQNPVYIFTFQG